MSENERLDCEFAIADSRFYCASFVRRKIKEATMCLSCGNISMVKQHLENIRALCNTNLARCLIDASIRKKQYAELLKMLSPKLVLGYSVEEAKNQFKSLAGRGYLKALTIVLLDDKKDIEPRFLQMAQELERKQSKTPEEWEALAAFYYDNKICVFGRGMEHIKKISDLFTEYRKWSNLVDFYGLDSKKSKYYEKAVVMRDYVYNAFKNQKYAVALRNAQEGYYKRFMEENCVDDVSSYLFLSGGNGELLLMPEVLKTYSENYFWSRKDFQRVLTKSFRNFSKKDKCDLCIYYFYNRYGMLSCGDRQTMKYISKLNSVASQGLMFLSEKNNIEPNIVVDVCK